MIWLYLNRQNNIRVLSSGPSVSKSVASISAIVTVPNLVFFKLLKSCLVVLLKINCKRKEVLVNDPPDNVIAPQTRIDFNKLVRSTINSNAKKTAPGK